MIPCICTDGVHQAGVFKDIFWSFSLQPILQVWKGLRWPGTQYTFPKSSGLWDLSLFNFIAIRFRILTRLNQPGSWCPVVATQWGGLTQTYVKWDWTKMLDWFECILASPFTKPAEFSLKFLVIVLFFCWSRLKLPVLFLDRMIAVGLRTSCQRCWRKDIRFWSGQSYSTQHQGVFTGNIL